MILTDWPQDFCSACHWVDPVYSKCSIEKDFIETQRRHQFREKAEQAWIVINKAENISARISFANVLQYTSNSPMDPPKATKTANETVSSLASGMDAPMARRLGYWMEKMRDPRKESDWVSLTGSASVQPLAALRVYCSAGRMVSRSVPPTARSKVQGSVQRRDYQRAILMAPGLVHPKDAS